MEKMKSSSAEASPFAKATGDKTEDKVEKIILGLVLVLGLSFCMAFGVVATDDDCPFPSRIHEGMDVDQGSGDGWLGIQQGVQQQQMPRYPQYQEPSQSQDSQDWLDISGGNLSYGMRSETIRDLQQKLSKFPEVYPEGLTTGYFGDLTKRAVERYQEKQGLQQTGIVDKDLRQFIWGWSVGPEFSESAVGIMETTSPFIETISCSRMCAREGYYYGICRNCAVYPGETPCEEDEKNLGEIAGCYVAPPGSVGVQKTCCCGDKINVDGCVDSDGGINKYIKGKTCQPSKKISANTDDVASGVVKLFCETDECQVNTVMNIPIGSGSTNIAEGMLTEYYCKEGKMMSKTIECIVGCKDGACVRPTGVTIVEICSGDTDCSETQFCDLDGCVAKTGTCVEVTDICTMIYAPVCGCDGKTYGSDCTRKSAKVSKKYNGECGAQEQCAKEGDTPGSQGCCSGLVKKGAATVGDNGECLYMRHLECLPCGDDICDGNYENKCNCPEDCGTITPTVDLQPIITLIREAINRLNEAIKLLYALSGQQLTTGSVGGGSGSSSNY